MIRGTLLLRVPSLTDFRRKSQHIHVDKRGIFEQNLSYFIMIN